jgi:D-alanyl-D-alanine carboxypeptidase (penicillin-binding protein 5/6)
VSILRLAVAAVIIVSLSAILFSQRIPIVLKNDSGEKPSAEIPALYPYPVPQASFEKAPGISARSAVVLDAKTGITLFEKEPEIRHLPASTTKLMTALVALEKCSPEKLVRIGFVEEEPTQMGLSQGDVVSVKNLLYGLLVSSGNDAAFALSYSCAASTEDFVREMNLKAAELQMHNSRFENPAGFDSPVQYTTARDLAKLAKVAIANPLLAKIVATKQTVVTDASGQKTYYLSNINKLLGEVDGVEGVKTGQTEGSLEVLVTQTTRNNNTIVAVVLGSQDRFLDSKQLIEWVFRNHQWVAP